MAATKCVLNVEYVPLPLFDSVSLKHSNGEFAFVSDPVSDMLQYDLIKNKTLISLEMHN